MPRFKIQKESLQPHFLGINVNTAGLAAGHLKFCGLRVYLYLMSNSDGFTWNMNPVAFAKWLDMDYSDPTEARKVRKIIGDGIVDLKNNGLLREDGVDSYTISEQIVPEWLPQSFGTNCSTQVSSKEQIVPKKLEASLSVLEQFVPEQHETSLGTKSSETAPQTGGMTHDCHGF